MLLHALCTREPAHTVLAVDLDSRLQLGVMQAEIIDRSNSHYFYGRKSLTHAVHEGAALGAEVVGHLLSTSGAFVVGILRKQILATDELYRVILGDEVRGKHRCGDFAACEWVLDNVSRYEW